MQGFTLVELLVVVLILGILATVAVASYAGKEEGPKVTVTKTLLRELTHQISLFKMMHGRLPESLDDLIARPSWIDPKKWPEGGYVLEVPKDGWGNDFVYRRPGTDYPFDLVSYGSDGQPGGDGYAEDLWNHARRN